MDKPSLNLGFLTYYGDRGGEEVEFYYPEGVTWGCIRCGACCGDVESRERMIRLLYRDIRRIEEVIEEEFYVEWDEGAFEGLMLKEDGKCIFLTDEGCRIYDARTLLCRMYPFWLERRDDFFVFGVDAGCPGTRKGELLGEDFYSGLLRMALGAMDY